MPENMVSQTEKHKYHMMLPTVESRKKLAHKWINETKQKQTHRYREQAHGGQKKGGRGVTPQLSLPERLLYLHQSTYHLLPIFFCIYAFIVQPLP